MANGSYFLEPAMMTYPKRIIKYDRRGFSALAPITPGFFKCLTNVLCAEREQLVVLTRLKSLVSLMAFTRLAAFGSASKSAVMSTDLKEDNKPETGMSGDVCKPLWDMFHACLKPSPYRQAEVETRNKAGLVWELYINRARLPSHDKFADRSQVESVLFERQDLWKLDKPCVNLIRGEDVEFFRCG